MDYGPLGIDKMTKYRNPINQTNKMRVKTTTTNEVKLK